jgi:hypothetical protein
MVTARRVRSRGAGVALLGALVWAGCSSNPVTGVQIEVRNDADNFQYHATALNQQNDVHSYTWQNSGTRATLDLTTDRSAGTVHLVVRDAANATVYDADLPANLVTSTTLGTAGSWHVNVTLTGYTGNVAILISKL